MRPLALFASLAILLGCFACTTGGKAPAPTTHFYTEGARALTSADQLATRGCNQGAVKSYFKAVELFTLADAQDALATCFNNMGNLYLGDGKTADALHYYREAQALHTRNGNLEGRVRVLTNMAAAYLADASPAKAEETLNQAEPLMTQGEIAWPQASVVRANLLLHSGNAQGALGLLLEAKSSLKAPEAPLTASLHFALGRSLFALNRYEEALTHFSKALDVDRKRGALSLMVKDLREMGRTLGAMDQPAEATRVLERALGIASLLGAEAQQMALQKMITDLPGDSEGSPSSVTDYFIERWTSGEIFAAPCN
jgi:tetratricopeptide (TPR) repeat protein